MKRYCGKENYKQLESAETYLNVDQTKPFKIFNGKDYLFVIILLEVQEMWTTSSQSEISTETATEYDTSSEASSRETSRPSSPESGNLTTRSVYLPLPEMAILHKTVHNAIHAVREQQRRAVTRKFFQQQQEVAASKLKCLSQIEKTSTPDPHPPSQEQCIP